MRYFILVKVTVKNKDYAHLQPLLTTHLHLYCPWQSLLLYFEQPQFEPDEGETLLFPPKHPTNANNIDEIRNFFILIRFKNIHLLQKRT